MLIRSGSISLALLVDLNGNGIVDSTDMYIIVDN